MKLNKLILCIVVVFSCAMVKASGDVESYDMSDKATTFRNLLLTGTAGLMVGCGVYTFATQNNIAVCYKCKEAANDECLCLSKKITRATAQITIGSGVVLISVLGFSLVLSIFGEVKNFVSEQVNILKN